MCLCAVTSGQCQPLCLCLFFSHKHLSSWLSSLKRILAATAHPRVRPGQTKSNSVSLFNSCYPPYRQLTARSDTLNVCIKVLTLTLLYLSRHLYDQIYINIYTDNLAFQHFKSPLVQLRAHCSSVSQLFTCFYPHGHFSFPLVILYQQQKQQQKMQLK